MHKCILLVDQQWEKLNFACKIMSGEGGPFDGYFTALSNLGAEYVRYSPWYPYPKVVVPELTPPDCTATKPATNWNSTLFDGIVRDFMEGVCGEEAITGVCEHSVAQQLSTMPDWIYQGAYPVPAGVINPDPWKFNAFNVRKFRGFSARGLALCSVIFPFFVWILSHVLSASCWRLLALIQEL
jgi:hypothetical protein